MSRLDITELKEKIRNSIIGDPSFTDVNEAIMQYNKTLSELYNQMCPEVTKKCAKKSKPWFTGDLRKLRKEMFAKNKLVGKEKITKEEFAEIRKEYYKKVKKKRNAYYDEYLARNATDAKKVFKMTKKLTNNEPVKALPKRFTKEELPEKFHEFFFEI